MLQILDVLWILTNDWAFSALPATLVASLKNTSFYKKEMDININVAVVYFQYLFLLLYSFPN